MARDTHSLLRASHESHKCESSVSVEKRKEGREGGKEEGVVLRKPAPEPLGFYSLMGTLCSLFSDQGLVTQPRKVVFVGSWRGANLCEGGGYFSGSITCPNKLSILYDSIRCCSCPNEAGRIQHK